MTDRTLLGACFAMDIIGPVAKKRFFGGYNVPALSVVIASISVFQKGALLGFARAEQYDLLCTLIAQPGGESSVAEFSRNLAKKHWDEHGDETKSLFNYAARIEFPTFDVADPKILKTLATRKYRLGEVLNRFAIAAVGGIGFGATRPDDFSAMWQRSYEEIDTQAWSEAVQAGLNIPATPLLLPLSEAIQPVLAETAQYAREHFPKLVSPLNLDNC
jgi:hypothetical protein